MATIGNSQFIKPIIDDTTQSTQTTYSSDKINDLMKQFGAEDTVYLLTVSDTAPASFTTGDKYYDTNRSMVFEAIDNTTWNTGSTPSKFTLYVDLAHHKIYVYHNNNFVAVSGSVTISEEDKNAIVDKPDGMYVEDLSEEVRQINIAQKTVNTLGYEDLLSTQPTFVAPFNNATGSVNKVIELEKPITDYEFIDFYLSAYNTSAKRTAQVTRIKVSDIVYNNSITEKQDMSIFNLSYSLNAAVNIGGDSTMIAKCWFQDPTHLYIFKTINVSTSSWNTYRFDHILGISKEVITVDPVNYIDTTQGIEDIPVGNVIDMQGPRGKVSHYLFLDGSEYNITDYPDLAQYFKEVYGTINYFGGDGVTTFAVPKYNEYIYWSPSQILTYTATASSTYNSSMPASYAFDNNVNTYWHSVVNKGPHWLQIDFKAPKLIYGFGFKARTTSANYHISRLPKQFDLLGSNDGSTWTTINSWSGLDTDVYSNGQLTDLFEFSISDNNGPSSATYRYYRFANMYCNDCLNIAEVSFLGYTTDDFKFIKAEPTYFIGSVNGHEEVIDLIDNSVMIPAGTHSSTVRATAQDIQITLKDNITNYDKIEVLYGIQCTAGEPTRYYRTEMFRASDIFYNTTHTWGKGTLLLHQGHNSAEHVQMSTAFNFKDAKTLDFFTLNYPENNAWVGIEILKIRGVRNIYDIDKALGSGSTGSSCDCENPTETDITTAINASITELNK